MWARFRYPVLGPVNGERPMRATTGPSGLRMPDAARVIAVRVITSKPKSTFIPFGYVVIMFSTFVE